MLRDAGIDKAVDSIYLLIENIVPDRVPAIREALRHELEKSSWDHFPLKDAFQPIKTTLGISGFNRMDYSQ